MATNPYNAMMWANPGPNGMYGPNNPMSMPQQGPYGTGPGQMGPAVPNPPQGGPQPGMLSPVTKYGYGTAPGQSGLGYYEQQTPAGSFAAAEYQRASNPYIGQTSQGIGQQWGGSQNPYLGQSAGQASAAGNQFFGANNPYTTQAIDAASQDAIRNYNLGIAPQRDAQAARSGSFGNTGVQQMQLEDQRNLQGTLGNIANSARMADLFRQQDMGEADANRRTGVSQFNVGARAGDLGRNLAGSFQGQDMGMRSAMFDATLGANDLARNSGLSQQLGMFNAGQANASNIYNTGAANNMLENFRNREQRSNEFDQGMDFQTWQANNQNMRAGQRDTMDFLRWMTDMQGTGINAGTNVQNTPLNYWQQFAGTANQAGGLGGSNNQYLQGNPWLGGLGGWFAGPNLFNP